MTEWKGHKPTIEHSEKGSRVKCECGYKGRWYNGDFMSEVLPRRHMMHQIKSYLDQLEKETD